MEPDSSLSLSASISWCSQLRKGGKESNEIPSSLPVVICTFSALGKEARSFLSWEEEKWGRKVLAASADSPSLSPPVTTRHSVSVMDG